MTNANPSGQHVIERIPHLLWGSVDTYTDDLMVVSALRLCLDKIGPKCSKAYIAGTCGAAFDIGWARGTLDAGADGAIFAHTGHFEPGIANLFKAVGWQHTVAYRSEPDKLWDVAVASLLKDRPVVAVEWESNHFVVLTAYDTTEHSFFGWRYEFKDDASQDYVPILPETLSHVIGVGKPIQPISPRDAALGALRVAVANARTGTDTDATGQGGSGDPMIYGPRAYEEHARLIPDE
ncbi:MAG: hypothetical protein NTU88_05205, partial [Armatimonadetes bacterium]|nr:hypothetical protein [Armatimonadota bacterium]